MKRLIYILAFVLVFATTGFAAVSFMQGRSQHLATQDNATPIALPTALVGFPDIEYVPIYPNAFILGADLVFNGQSRPIANMSRADISYDVPDARVIAYEVTTSPDKVIEFYQEMLPKKGWHLRSSHDLIGGQPSLFSWTDPARKLGWGQYLKATIELALDNSKTQVDLEYGRYPIIDEGLPLYADAQEVATTNADTEMNSSFGKVPVHITDITYLSSAGLQEISDFYNNSMLEYGWIFFDRSGAGEVTRQTGDISTQEGLYFRFGHIGWDMHGCICGQLFVTATVQKDGRTFAKLHVEEATSSAHSP